MSSPHERDGRMYGFNQDPYTRDPYRDPYTGYPVDPPSTSYLDDSERLPAEPTPVAASRRPQTTRSFHGAGVFLGGLIATAACGVIAGWLLLVVAVGELYRFADRMGYWQKKAIAPVPVPPTLETVIVSVIFAVAVAGSLMWLMKLVVPAAGTFFRLLGVLLGIAAALLVWQSGEGAATAPVAVGVLILSVGIVIGVEVCGRYLHVRLEVK